MENTLQIRVAGTEDIGTIRDLALAIWPVTYGDILTPDQLNYMLELIYSKDSLQEQMTHKNHHFILISWEGKTVGFAAWSAIEIPGTWKLHKLYVHPVLQGKGIGKAVMDHVVEQVKLQKAKTLRLNVNRFNKARSFYGRLGFKVIGEEDVDIGNGYFMEDYIMEKDFE